VIQDFQAAIPEAEILVFFITTALTVQLQSPRSAAQK
jgi:hypothetical protein